MLLPALCVAMGLYVLQQLVLSASLLRRRPWDVQPPQATQRVAILVAARNEQHNILRCLEHLAAQDYPTHLLEVWVGDDRSEDRTAAIVQAFIADKPNFHYCYIANDLPSLRGKQNVLAQLAQQTDAALLLFVDADVAAPPQWAGTLAGQLQHHDIAGGITIVQGPGLWAGLQMLDWLAGGAVFWALGRLGLPVSVAGNNMGLTRQAYDKVGGYQGIPFSITEDYALLQAVVRSGGLAAWPVRPALLNTSTPIAPRDYLQQRARWLRGGRAAPWYGKWPLQFQGLLYLALALAAFALPLATIGWLYLAMSVADALLTYALAARLAPRRWWRWFWLFVPHRLYLLAAFLILPAYAYLGKTTRWKGRTF